MEGEAPEFVVIVLVSAGCAADPSTAVVWLGPSISSEHMPWVRSIQLAAACSYRLSTPESGTLLFLYREGPRGFSRSV